MKKYDMINNKAPSPPADEHCSNYPTYLITYIKGYDS